MSDTKVVVVTTPNTLSTSSALQTDSNGNPQTSATTSTELGYVSGVTSAIQTQLNAKQSSTLTNGHVLVGNASNVATDVAMSGDVTISNAGATTVGSVGGSSSTNIHSAELAANAATNANTASTIVKRDSSGNFSAGTITAALSGNATTATSATTATTAGNVTGTVAIANGGTGQTTQQAALDAIAGAVSSGQYLRGNGTHVSMSALQQADLPTIALTSDVTGSASGGSIATTIANSAVTNAKMANMADKTVKGNTSGGSAAPSDLSLVSTATASTVMYRDSNKNTAINNINEAFTSTTTSSTPVSLTVSSAPLQQFTGSTAQTLNLPDCTTLVTGFQFYVFNRSTATVTVKDAGGTTVQAMVAGTQACFTCASIGSSAGSWDLSYTYAGTLPVSFGGTGQTTLTAHDVLVGNGTSGITQVAPSSTTGVALVSNGSSSDPSFGQVNVGSSSAVTGTLAVGNGGTGQTSYTDGQLLIGNTSGNTLTKATLTAGSNITITNGNGSISIAASSTAAPAYSYSSITSDPAPGVISSYYVLSSTSFTFTLPTAVGQAGKDIILQHNGTSLTQVYTLNTTSSQTINRSGGTVLSGNYKLYTNGEVLRLMSDGSNWQVIHHKTDTLWTNAGAMTIHATTSNPIKASTTVTDEVWWRRVGRNAELRYAYKHTNSTGSANGSGDYLWVMPTNLTIDTADLTAFTTVIGGGAIPYHQNAVGIFQANTTGNGSMVGTVSVYDSTNVRCMGSQFSSTGATSTFGGSVSTTSAAYAEISQATVSYVLTFSVPISGWQP